MSEEKKVMICRNDSEVSSYSRAECSEWDKDSDICFWDAKRCDCQEYVPITRIAALEAKVRELEKENEHLKFALILWQLMKPVFEYISGELTDKGKYIQELREKLIGMEFPLTVQSLSKTPPAPEAPQSESQEKEIKPAQAEGESRRHE